MYATDNTAVFGTIASPTSRVTSRSAASCPFPVQRRSGGGECLINDSDQKIHFLTSKKPTVTSTSVGIPTFLLCRRIGLRLQRCCRNAAQRLSSKSDFHRFGERRRIRATHTSATNRLYGNADQHEMRYIRPLDEAVADQYCTNLVVNSRYTIQNFLFKNLYEQFRRPLNFYFLLVAMLQFIAVIAPVNPLSTLLPLLFAFTLTAVKEGYDDVKRHRQDYTYNHTHRMVLDAKNSAWVSHINAEIRVGDVLLLRENEEVPCDVIVLGATSAVYIRTDNLDGEIDLKSKEMVQWSTIDPVSHSRRTYAACEVPSQTEPPPALSIVAAVSGLCLVCPPPSSIIDFFEGRADLTPKPQGTVSDAGTAAVQVPLTHHHLLPQSCVLKNVAQAVCVAVYTGDDTKCGMNKGEAPVKWAQIDKDVSRYSVYIFVCQILNAAIFGFIGFQANRSAHETAWYLPLPANEASASALIYPLRFFLLTTVMIPVSFKFVVDVCKYYMASVVEWDVAMMHATATTAALQLPESSACIGCKVRNSNILEDLGQIDYVLSDKTGTLTQNMMELDSVTICPGHHLAVSNISGAWRTLPEELKKHNPTTLAAVQQFAQMVALCNTVEVVHPRAAAGESASVAEIAYHAASPDEVALCLGMRKLGVSLVYRDEHRVVLRMHRGQDGSRYDCGVQVAGKDGEEEDERTWAVHHIFHFSSEKKTMGIVVEEPDSGRIWFVVKGADDRVMAMASPMPPSSIASVHSTSSPLHPECAAKLSLYAHRGLRTLLVACRELTRDELTVFLRNVAEAGCLVEGRQAHLDSLRAQMESGVTIIGITAIEDKLQDNVQETIGDMLVAGIKVWMLTGDKMETAEQIGLSCGLYRASDTVIRIGEGASEVANTSNWRQNLFAFPIEQLPQSSAAAALVSQPAAQMCGNALEARVLCFDASDSSQLSNEPLRLMAQTAGGIADGTASSTGGGVFVSGAAERSAVLVMEGGTVLDTILRDPGLRARFCELSSRCRSVICARTTPSQKAAITKLVREGGFLTLSVGDGGNDVAMLQEAHVGVGISGKEGQQAARAADFSITQFSDLRTLLFVHGQQAYIRTAYVIKYSFYKSMLISFIQLAYNAIGTHMSGGTFWNSFSLTMWNGFYTLPQTILYCLDRCAPRVVLERNPYLYKMTRHAVDICPSNFFGSFVFRGVLQSIGLLWLSTRLYGPDFAYADSGGAASNDVTFSVAYTALMLSQLYTMWWESHAVTPLNLLVLVSMPLFYVYSTMAYSDNSTLQYFGVFRKSLDIAGVLSALGISIALMVPSIIYFTVLAFLQPNPRDVLRRAEDRRQRLLLKRRDYKRMQPCWVRWFGATPEESSIMCRRGDTAPHMYNEGDLMA